MAALPLRLNHKNTPEKNTMSSELIRNVTDASFDNDVLGAGVPVLVDFWAAWCVPCRQIAPLLDDLAEVYRGRVQIVKLNVDENRKVAAELGIRGIPTLILFKNGQPAGTLVGARGKAQIQELIDLILAAD